jgi:hypothetical protein
MNKRTHRSKEMKGKHNASTKKPRNNGNGRKDNWEARKKERHR